MRSTKNPLKSYLDSKSASFVEVYNVITLSLSGFFTSIAFFTCASIAQPVLEGAYIETYGQFSGHNFASLCLIYAFSISSNFSSPKFIRCFGSLVSVMISEVVFTFYLISYFFPNNWLFYFTSITTGLADSLLWISLCTYITTISNKSTMTRNFGILAFPMGLAYILSELVIQFVFHDEIIIFKNARRIIFMILIIVSIVGLVPLFFMTEEIEEDALNLDMELSLSDTTNRSLDDPAEQDINMNEIPQSDTANTSLTLLESVKHKSVLLLSMTAMYCGLVEAFSLTFLMGVGDIQVFGIKAKSLMSSCGIAKGSGILCSGTLGILLTKNGRDHVVMVMFIFTAFCAYAIYISLPEDALLGETKKVPYFGPSPIIVIICSFLLGLIQYSLMILINSSVGVLFPSQPAPVFCIIHLINTVISVISFFLSSYIQLQWHCLLIVIISLLGSWTYFIVEWRIFKKNMFTPQIAITSLL